MGGHDTTSKKLHIAQRLTWAMVPLAALAAGGGLLLPRLYREPQTIVPAMRGQDLITLLMLPPMVWSLLAARHGSTRAMLVWIGLLGYLFYTYAGAAMAYYVNIFTLVYVALFSLSIFALVVALTGLDVDALQRRFDACVPRRSVAAYLTMIVLVLVPLEIGQNVGFIATGMLPESVRLAGGTSYYVYALDLGLVVPLSLLSVYWLWRNQPWGYIGAGCMLIKGAAMGLALLSMNVLSWLTGKPADSLELIGFYVLLAGGGLALSAELLRHCR
jgi:hypothetical protein